jgi:hypothetical protein
LISGHSRQSMSTLSALLQGSIARERAKAMATIDRWIIATWSIMGRLGVGEVFSVFLFEKVSEWQTEVQINKWRTWLTTLTAVYSE